MSFYLNLVMQFSIFFLAIIIPFQVWSFSTSIDAIDEWRMEGLGRVSEHLKTCPYNVRCEHRNAATRNSSWDTIINKISTFDIYRGLKRVEYWWQRIILLINLSKAMNTAIRIIVKEKNMKYILKFIPFNFYFLHSGT